MKDFSISTKNEHGSLKVPILLFVDAVDYSEWMAFMIRQKTLIGIDLYVSVYCILNANRIDCIV